MQYATPQTKSKSYRVLSPQCWVFFKLYFTCMAIKASSFLYEDNISQGPKTQNEGRKRRRSEAGDKADEGIGDT